MPHSVLFKPLSLSFTIVTLIETLLWSVLSFLAILCYNDVIDYDSSSENYGLRNFSSNLYKLYLSGEIYRENSRFVTPNTFYVFMWLYFMISLFLVFSSAIHITVLCQKPKRRKLKVSTIVWLVLIYMMCLFDVITCIFFGIDYDYLKDVLSGSNESELILAVPLTLMILAAKGFVLWIFNLTAAITVTILFVQNPKPPQIKMESEFYGRVNAAYNGFGDSINEDTISNVHNEDQSIRQSGDPNNNTHSVATSDSGNDDSHSTTSTWSRLPRASSFVRPRSLDVNFFDENAIETRSLGAPSYATVRTRSQNYDTGPYPWQIDNENHRTPVIDDYQSVNDVKNDDDNDDDVTIAQTYYSYAVPLPQRFTMKEPAPDYI